MTADFPAGSEAIARAVDSDAQRVHAGTLQPGCASFFRAATVPCRGVVLMLHGWSAGPWQFIPLATALSAHGLHCYAARLPGHGACRPPKGEEDSSELPLSRAYHTYSDTADQALGAVQNLALAHKVPLFIIGFSAGGALATDLLQRHAASFTRAVLMAPLLRPRSLNHRLIFAVLNALLPAIAVITDRISMSWGALPVTEPGGWVRPGHWFFRFGHLQAIVAYGQEVWRRAKALATPTQFIITDLDDKADGKAAQILRGNGDTRHHLWRFKAAEGVPHAMLTAEENPNDASREHIARLVQAFLLEGKGQDSEA